jgi:nitrite reductase (NO-forming)
MVYSGKQDDRIYQPEGGAVQEMPGVTVVSAPESRTLQERMELGANVYAQNCLACHQPNGAGIPNAFPPLAKSDFLMADEARAIRTVSEGMTGKVTVNGVEYDGIMPKPNLTDDQIANVMTYVRNSWGNEGGLTTIKAVRAAKSSGTGH